MMLIDKKHIERLGIFFFYDKDGIADTYIDTLLSGIKPHLTKLMIVCNGKITKGSKQKFQKYAENVLVRENKGFDVWAYKEGIEHYGWEHIERFDELILFNFTIFGPIYPFSETFKKMDSKNVDFWGMTVHNGWDTDPWQKTGLGYLPKHIQSHFIAVRNSMIRTRHFKEYWENMQEITCYEDSVCYHEAVFTKKFAELGFTWDVYVDTSDITRDDTAYPLMMMPVDLVKNRYCPIVKRKSFFIDMLDLIGETMGEPSYELFNFIKHHTNYDEDQILQNIIRTCNQYDIKNCFQFNYILPSEISYAKYDKKQPKVALFMYIFFDDSIEYCCKYAASMPSWADIYVTTDTEEKKQKIMREFSNLETNKLKVLVIKNRGRDVSALLIGFRQFVSEYDYVCFAHDKKGTNIKPRVAGKSFSYLCFEGILKSREYVNNIIATFEENTKLGLLTSPTPIHGNYFGTLGHEWGGNFEGCLKLIKEMGLKVNIDKNKAPIAPYGTEFWFRSKALEPLFKYNFSYEDFPDEGLYEDPEFRKKENILHQIERLYPFIVQSQGYHPAWVMPESLASMEITLLNYYLTEINRALDDKDKGYGPSFGYTVNKLKHGKELMTWHENQLKIHKELVAKQKEDLDSLVAECIKLQGDIKELRQAMVDYPNKLEGDIKELKEALLAAEQEAYMLKSSLPDACD